MRNVSWTAAALLGLALAAAPASAQGLTNLPLTTQGTGGFSAGAAQTVINTPIDLSNAIAAFPGQTSGSSGLGNFFHSFHLPSWPTTVGSSPYPSPSSFPSTQYPNFKPVPFVPVPGSPPPSNIAVQHISN